MSDSKISGLPGVAAFAATQEFAVNDSGTSRKISGAQLIAAVAQGTLSGGYAPVTANQGGITTATDLTSLTITVTTLAGRRYRISCFTTISSTVGTDAAALTIQEGVTILQTINQASMGAANFSNNMVGWVIITPSAGAHTYKLTLARAAGTGTLTLQADATHIASILMEDIGV